MGHRTSIYLSDEIHEAWRASGLTGAEVFARALGIGQQAPQPPDEPERHAAVSDEPLRSSASPAPVRQPATATQRQFPHAGHHISGVGKRRRCDTCKTWIDYEGD